MGMYADTFNMPTSYQVPIVGVVKRAAKPPEQSKGLGGEIGPW